LSSLGIEVHLMGVAPTPAIAYAAASSDVVSLAITASHNPYSDNGVKIFGRGGRKLTDEQESQIESELAREMSREEVTTSSKSLATFHPEYLERYRAALVASAPKNALAKLHIALDCANGAMSEVASAVLVALGAKVSVIHSSPNGKNINHQCGATNPGELREFVKKFRPIWVSHLTVMVIV
jgi:phosphoglucosamine mutase